MKENAKKRNPYLIPLTMLLLTVLLLLGVTLLRHYGIYKEKRSLVLVNGHTEGSDVEVSFLRSPATFQSGNRALKFTENFSSPSISETL